MLQGLLSLNLYLPWDHFPCDVGMCVCAFHIDGLYHVDHLNTGAVWEQVSSFVVQPHKNSNMNWNPVSTDFTVLLYWDRAT